MNKKFNEYKSINYYDVGSDILSFWKKRKIFEKSITLRNNGDVFSFYEGPPSANGMPGIHHVMSRTVKDIFCRYKTLKGFKVYRKGGWDAHGLPVEIQEKFVVVRLKPMKHSLFMQKKLAILYILVKLIVERLLL